MNSERVLAAVRDARLAGRGDEIHGQPYDQVGLPLLGRSRGEQAVLQPFQTTTRPRASKSTSGTWQTVKGRLLKVNATGVIVDVRGSAPVSWIGRNVNEIGDDATSMGASERLLWDFAVAAREIVVMVDRRGVIRDAMDGPRGWIGLRLQDVSLPVSLRRPEAQLEEFGKPSPATIAGTAVWLDADGRIGWGGPRSWRGLTVREAKLRANIGTTAAPLPRDAGPGVKTEKRPEEPVAVCGCGQSREAIERTWELKELERRKTEAMDILREARAYRASSLSDENLRLELLDRAKAALEKFERGIARKRAVMRTVERDEHGRVSAVVETS